MAVQQVSQLTLALVAGGFTSFGVLAEIGYDGVVARRTAKRENLTWLADERRVASRSCQRAPRRRASKRQLVAASAQGVLRP
jgi:hypothetical protein